MCVFIVGIYSKIKMKNNQPLIWSLYNLTLTVDKNNTRVKEISENTGC